MISNYRVPETNLETLKARLAKLAKRCLHIGVQVPVITVGPFEEVRCKKTDEFEGLVDMVVRYYPVTLDAPERPKIDGWEFVAVIAPVSDEKGNFLGNVLRAVPGTDAVIPQEYRAATNNCDHCHTVRRRNDTFVIRHIEDNTFKQVGRNCLANFLGLTNPHALAELAQIIIDAADLCGMAEGDNFGGGFGEGARIALDDVLAIAAAAIRLYGWKSNAVAKEFNSTSTSMRVNTWIFGTKKDRDEYEFPLIPTEADTQLAQETTDWLNALSMPETDNDYVYNLSLLAKSVSVTAKNFGLAVSAINAYSRAKEREIRRNKMIESDAASQHIGQPSERLDFEATVVFTTTFENDFGVTHFYKMKQGDNVLVYFSSRDLEWNQGDTVKFKATVKKHDVRDSIKQTVVTRATLPKYQMTKDEKKAVTKLRRILEAPPV